MISYSRHRQLRVIGRLVKLAMIAALMPFTAAAIWKIWQFVQISAELR